MLCNGKRDNVKRIIAKIVTTEFGIYRAVGTTNPALDLQPIDIPALSQNNAMYKWVQFYWIKKSRCMTGATRSTIDSPN
jgi:hypothetical protein